MRPRGGTRTLLEVCEALGESDDVLDHGGGEVGHVWQSREKAALSGILPIPGLLCFRGASTMAGRER